MKVGIMGGTFDPIHIGHMLAATSALEGAGLDEVWFMPSNIPPHKPAAPKATASQRWDMVCLAVDGHPHFRATDIELQMGGISYSADTIGRLREKHPEIRFHYIIGADMVQYLPKWVRIEEIVSRIGFIGLQRPGTELQPGDLPVPIREAVTIVQMPQLDISSTAIRSRLAEGKSARYWVTDSVLAYMEENQLYGSS
jgi:nicotinate-nucleotide adenylyltransferase